jgi:hypothetical protein
MGNWCTVSLRGTLAKSDVDAVREFVTCEPDFSNFHCLTGSISGLCGLGMWPAEEIHVDGNLAERNYDADSVADTLREIVKIAPSLSLKVHCGGEYEDKTCVATVTAHDGEVLVGDPEVETVSGISDDAFKGRLFGAILGDQR